jgi:hypothetical protein
MLRVQSMELNQRGGGKGIIIRGYGRMFAFQSFKTFNRRVLRSSRYLTKARSKFNGLNVQGRIWRELRIEDRRFKGSPDRLGRDRGTRSRFQGSTVQKFKVRFGGEFSGFAIRGSHHAASSYGFSATTLPFFQI